jgi:hypothetical protein
VSVVCAACGHAGHTVHYQRPEKVPRQVRFLVALCLASAAFAAYNLSGLIVLLVPMADAAAAAFGAVEAGAVDMSAEETDYVRILFNSTHWIVGVLLLVFLVLPLRIFYYAARLHEGNPHHLSSLRLTAVLQGLLELLATLTLLVATLNLETSPIQFFVGYNLVLAPAILLYSRRRVIREYYSVYHLERTQAPPTQAPAV